jgi:glycosyltransferase involved in cell wall biosynthesis
MPKILKMSPYFYPEQVSSSHMTRDLNEELFRFGYTIENYVPTPSRGITKALRDKYKGIKLEELDDGHTIVHRFFMFPEGKNPLQRAIRYILVNLVQYKKGSQAEGIDLIYAGSTPPTQGLLCAKVKRKLVKRYGHNVPFVFNLQDIFPDSLVNAKMTHKGSLIWKMGRKIEDYAYRNADIIITISEDFKENILAKGVPESKIKVIPNWVNTENVYAVNRDDNILFHKYHLDPSLFYICYSGNIGHSQNLELLLSVAKRIREELPSVHFVLIGEGAAKEETKQKIESEKIDNITMLPFQDYSLIPHVFSLGDAGLIISKPGVGGSSVPSKTWSIMAAERPIIASFDINSELAKLITISETGIVADAGDEAALIEAIRLLVNDFNKRLKMGSNGVKYLKEHANKEMSVRQYLSAMNEVLGISEARA